MRSHNIQLAHFNKATFAPYLDLVVIVLSQFKHAQITALLHAVEVSDAAVV
jgi:hypothetical protein